MKKKSTKIKIEDYIVLKSRLLGKGAMGKVYLGYRTKNPDDHLAIKKVNLKKFPDLVDYVYDLVEKEIQNLLKVDHPNIIKILDVKKSQKNLYIITEYCPDGDFVKLCGNLERSKIILYFRKIAEAMLYINSKSLIHRDIKPANILLSKDEPKIADLGFSRSMKDVKIAEEMTSGVGTPLYMAPEVYHESHYESKCDVWSTGIMLYEMIYGLPPWTGNSEPDLFRNIKEIPLKFEKNGSMNKDLKDLIEKMLEKDPKKRLDFEGVLKHKALSTSPKKEEEEKKMEMHPYLDYIDKLSNFYEKLAENISNQSEILGLSENVKGQLVLLFNKYSTVLLDERYRLCAGKKGNSFFNSEEYSSYKHSFKKQFEKKNAVFDEKTKKIKSEIELSKDFKKSIIKNDDISSKDFKNIYREVCNEAIIEINEILENWSEQTPPLAIKTAFKLIKVKSLSRLKKCLGYDENTDVIEDFEDLLDKYESKGVLFKKFKKKFDKLFE